MEITHFRDLRPRTVWDIVDDAFDLYRENLALFGGIVLLLLVPAASLYAVWMVTSLGEMILQQGSQQADPFEFLRRFFSEFAFALGLYAAGYVIYSAATAVAVQDRLAGKPGSVAAAYRQAARHALPLIGASLLVGLLAILGACTMYIMTTVVLVFYAFISQTIVLERRGAMDGARRSTAIVSGYGWRVFGMIVLLGLLSTALSVALSALIQLVLLIPALQGGDQAAQEWRSLLVSQVAQLIGSALIAPIGPIALTLMYYDLRVRREGLDIEAYAADIGFPLAPDPFGAASPGVGAAGPGAGLSR